MHEYGIVRSVLSVVDEQVHAHDGRRALRVLLGASGMTGAEERLLHQAFDAFKADTTARDAELVVERVPLEVCCVDCGAQASLADSHDRRCPRCGSDAALPIRGQDIFLKSVEIEV